MACTCTTAGIQIIVVLLAFTVFSFAQTGMALPSNFWQRISPTFGCIPANKLLIVSHALTALFSCMELHLTVDLPARVVGTGRLLIVWSMNNITGPGYKLNCARQGEVGGLSTE